jgi:molybdopterin synthase catalytic subunit
MSKMQSYISVQEQDFCLQDEYDQLRTTTSGAIVTFTGLVREFNQTGDSEQVDTLFLQHYPGMTESLLQKIIDEAAQRWPLDGVRVIHRVGALAPGDQIVLVAVSSAHREAAFNGASFLMDYLKTQATFWKKTLSGQQQQWLEMKDSDKKAAKRWQQDSQQ